jgi:RimJ/RimL family protein N-acetyltransferase
MLLNEDTLIRGSKCILVPYTKDLVEKYHSWFVNDPELLETTCSELLTLEEEYANQESWRADESKLTFLIRDGTDASSPLCGDINCFFSDYYEDDWNLAIDPSTDQPPSGKVGELNLMIAEKSSRRRGIAREAISLFTEYMKGNMGDLKLLVAKIKLDNLASIRFFASIGFQEFKRVECFNEVHFIKDIR